ncbi:MAG: lipase [Fibrobacteres bacterium]|nr:lipase [Fibrobacterota bacterium]
MENGTGDIVIFKAKQGPAAFHAKLAAMLLSFAGIVMPCRGQANSVNLSGTVADAAGKPIAGAKVRLVGLGLSAATDANGKYSLTAQGTGLGHNGRLQPGTGNAPELKGGDLNFRIDGAARNVRIDFHSLSGQSLGEVMNALLQPGRYRISPSLKGSRQSSRPQVALLRVRIDAATFTLKMPLMLNAEGDGNRLQAMDGGDASPRLDKTGAAGGDSLDVLAIGYSRAGRGLAALTGTQDFRLNALQYNGVPFKAITLSDYEKKMTTLDVHVPTGPMPAGKWPVIVHLHGGGLQEGDSQEGWTAGNMNNFVRKIYDQGYLMICPNYRLGVDPDLPNGGAPRGKWPEYMEDAAASIAWARKHAEEYGGDTANFFVMGYSAGAWLAVMMAVDTPWYKAIGFDENRISGYIALSTHMTTYFEYAIEFNVPNTGLSPGAILSHIRKVDVPIRLFVGGLEEQRIPDNQTFVSKMKEAGARDIEVSVMPNRNHQQIVETIGNATDETRTLLLDFLKKHLK